jgi:hypothetical protein
MEVPRHLAADWLDGRSARAQPVEVWIDGAMLHFGDQSAPLARLSWPERQRHGQRQILLPGGGLLSFADATAFDAWAQASGRGDSLVVRWQQSWRLAATSFVLLVVLLAAAYRWGLPWAVDTAVDALPASAERALGEHLLDGLDRQWLKPSALPAAQQRAWSERWAAMLATARTTGRVALPERFEVHFRDGGKALGPNAFALPGGCSRPRPPCWRAMPIRATTSVRPTSTGANWRAPAAWTRHAWPCSSSAWPSATRPWTSTRWPSRSRRIRPMPSGCASSASREN